MSGIKVMHISLPVNVASNLGQLMWTLCCISIIVLGMRDGKIVKDKRIETKDGCVAGVYCK